MFQVIDTLYLAILACASLAYAGSLWRRFRSHEISWALVGWTFGTLCLSVIPAFIYVAGMMFRYDATDAATSTLWVTVLMCLGHFLILLIGTTIAVLVATGPGGSLGLIIGLVLNALRRQGTAVLGCRFGNRSGTTLIARLDIPETDFAGLVFSSTIGWALFLFGIWFLREQHWHIFS